MHAQLLFSKPGEHRNQTSNKTGIHGNDYVKRLTPHPIFTFSSKPGKRNTIALLLFYMIISSYACHDKKQDKKMDTPASTPQQTGDTGRLLSVVNLEQTDSGRKVIAWFFETPQVFEFSTDSTGAQNMLSQLKEAKEKQWPVRVHVVSDKDKNRITKVTPATEAQVADYKKSKARQEQAIPVPPPKNQ